MYKCYFWAYKNWLKSVHQVWWILLLLLLITPAPACLQQSRNLVHWLKPISVYPLISIFSPSRLRRPSSPARASARPPEAAKISDYRSSATLLAAAAARPRNHWCTSAGGFIYHFFFSVFRHRYRFFSGVSVPSPHEARVFPSSFDRSSAQFVQNNEA